MYNKKVPVRLDCGLHLFKELLTGKWKTMLLYYIYSGHKRPSELQRMIADADRRVLDKQLGELVAHGLISKTVYQGLPLKVEYELTNLGKTLEPVIISMDLWGEEHRGEIEKNIKTKLNTNRNSQD